MEFLKDRLNKIKTEISFFEFNGFKIYFKLHKR